MISRHLKLAGLLMEVEKKFHLEVPEDIEQIHQAFKRAGRKLYIVGGAIRDAVLKKTPKDFDVTTDAPPKEVENILNKAGIKNFPKGEQFGVISAVINGEEYEIATMREESYEDGDGRRPTSVSFSNMEQDVMRRDLKINALYYDIDKGVIIDLVGGLDDLKHNRVTPVGNPMDRFEEDKLRVLRAIRFSHRLGSELDDKTKKAIIHFNNLPGVSSERIRAEFLSGLKSALSPEKYLKDYEKFNLFKRVFPGANINTNFVSGMNDPILVIALLLSNNNPDDVFDKYLLDFKATNREKQDIKLLLNLKQKFSNFNKISFNLNLDSEWLINLKKAMNNSDLSKEQIMQWANINNLNSSAIKAFIIFQPTARAQDFPDLKGKNLGDAIKQANAQIFLNLL